MLSDRASGRMPVIFFGHGSPTTVLSDNPATRTWYRIAQSLPRPKGIIVVSAHWYTDGTCVTAMNKPRTIHDFGPLAPELFEMEYPAPGDPELAARIKNVMAPVPVSLDQSWGFDHGTWTVLMKAFPDADIPVVQLSLDTGLTAQEHFDLGVKLSAFRDEGILIIGSGNIVHNMSALIWKDKAPAYSWAERFRDFVVSHIESGDFASVVEYEKGGADALQATPFPDHYFPLLYVIGAAAATDRVSVETNFFQFGSIGMTSFVFEPGETRST